MSESQAIPQALRPEIQLLLAAASPQFSSDVREALPERIARITDWDFLFSAAARHGVRSLLFRGLKRAGYPGVPEASRNASDVALAAQAENNLVLAAELVRLLRLLNGNGIAAIPYKGPVLAMQAFGDLGLRDFGDLDILVSHSAIEGVAGLMQQDGYTLQLPGASVAAAATGAQVPGQYYFDRPPHFRPVEFHTERTLRYYPVPLDLDRLKKRLVTVRVAGASVDTFCAEDGLSVLSVHGSKHLWSRLQWVADLAWLVRATPDFSWELAMRSAQELSAERMMLTGLALASRLFVLELPSEIEARIGNDSGLQKLAAQALDELFSEASRPAGVAQRAVFRIRSTRRLGSGLRYLLRLLTSPSEEDWESAQGSHWKQVIMRPARLVRRYGWGFRRRPEKPANAPKADDPARRMA